MTAAPLARAVGASVTFIGLFVGGLWWFLGQEAAFVARMSAVDLAMFMVAAAVMELLPIRLPSGRAVPTSLAVVGAAAILGAEPPVLAAIAASGWVLARLIAREALPLGSLALRAVGGWALAGAAALGGLAGPGLWVGSVNTGVAASVDLGSAVVVVLAIVVGVPGLEAVLRAPSARFLARRVWEAVRENRLVGASVASTAVLGSLVHPVLGAWTLPTMLIPLFAARLGLDRMALGHRAYDQTIRAMSRLPEQLGNVAADHGVRVGDLAGDVALELGLNATLVAEVVRAAHLHELGRIKLERDAPAARRELAAAGASVIREVSALDRVASIVELHGDLDRGVLAASGLALPARIVAACCELDRYAPDADSPGQGHEVVVRLVREIGDLEVVAALTRVVERRRSAVGG